MIVLLGLVVLVAAAVVVVGGGSVTLFGAPSHPTRSGLGPPVALVALGGVVVVILLLLVAMLGIGGLRSGRSSSEAEPAGQMSVPERVGEDPPASVAGPKSTFDGTVRLEARRSDLRPAPSIGDLEPGDVLDVSVTGFFGGAEGVIAQCPELRAPACTNVYPVQADDRGRIRVPYRVVDAVGTDTLVVEIDRERVGAALVFGEQAPGLARLTADDGTVQITGGSPGATVRVARCDADAAALGQCTIGAPLVLLRDGSGRAEITGGRKSQRIVLVDDQGIVVADPVSLPGRPGPEVELDLTRLAVGFALALALLGVAVALIRSTDWRAPAEAATPFLDAAVFDA